jgi:hypothetical protein
MRVDHRTAPAVVDPLRAAIHLRDRRASTTAMTPKIKAVDSPATRAIGIAATPINA